MKGIFWNSRGLSDLAKSKFLKDTVMEQNLDFVALLETGKKDFSQTALNNFCGGKFPMALDPTSWEVWWHPIRSKP
jgi:hypothetical protein